MQPAPKTLHCQSRSKRGRLRITHTKGESMNRSPLSRVLFVLLITCAPTLATAAVDMNAAAAEVKKSYGKAHPQVQEYVLHTARSFGPSGLWMNENAFASLKPDQRDERVVYLAKLFEESEYGRHLCAAL